MLKEKGGFLPYHDKTDADEIYEVFGMSKKTFKMSIGTLFKQKKIVITNEGIEIVKRTFSDNKPKNRY
jgi:predicted RNA-binding protein (virulence factor B family)